MAIRIRVHPQGAGMGAYGANGAAMNAQYYQQKLENERSTNDLRLDYERALWNERLKLTQLQGQLSQPQVAGYPGMPVGVGLNAGIVPGLHPGMHPGGLPIGMGMPGSGQMNVTTQTANGAGNQHVSNSNTFSSYTMGGNSGFGFGFPFGGMGMGGYPPPAYGFGRPAGGFLSGLLGALI